MRKIALAAVLLLFGSALASASEIVVLDFQELEAVSAQTNNSVGAVYAQDGFRLTAFSQTNDPDFNYPGTLSTSYAGSTTLFHHISSGEVVLDRLDGGMFNFLSISLAELPPFDSAGNPIDNGPFELTFYGYRNDVVVKTEAVEIQPFPSLLAYSFKGFSAVTEVRWFQGAGGSAGPGFQTHQFDNVTLRPIPIPGVIALIGLGLAGPAVARRRKR